MNKDPLVSVIVPVYNVEFFLNDCIKSIINQSYKNLEIILVDDGSPDNSPQMCDEWALADNRIKVIHKNNGGLSSARNAGLDVAKGDYITFVDSDDFIDSLMYEKMVNVALLNDVDIVVVGIKRYYSKNHIEPFNSSNWNYKIKRDTLIDAHLYNRLSLSTKIDTTVWNKLYKNTLINNIRFKEGRLTEDFLFMYHVNKRVSQVYYLKDLMYNYRVRTGGICSNYSHINHTYLNIVEIEDDIKKSKKDYLLKYLYDFKNRFLISTCIICKKYSLSHISFDLYYNECLKIGLKELLRLPMKDILHYFILRIYPSFYKNGFN